MSAVGSLIFCTQCGNLLDSISHQQHLTCDVCQKKYNATEFSQLKVVTKTAAEAFPSALKSKKSLVKTSIKHDEIEDGASLTDVEI